MIPQEFISQQVMERLIDSGASLADAEELAADAVKHYMEIHGSEEPMISYLLVRAQKKLENNYAD